MFASFLLSEFRILAQSLADLYGFPTLGQDSGVPLVDSTAELKCHYTEQPIHALASPDYYLADKRFTLKTVGWCCAGCGLTISEDGRKKEKIGGANGKGIAKAKCPKCNQKFGSNPLYALETPAPLTPAAT